LIKEGAAMLHTVTRARRRLRARRELRHDRRVQHRSSAAQTRLYAGRRGHEPLTYLLDPDANWMPQGLVLEQPYGLALTFRDDRGRLDETAALPDGGRFELFAPVTEHELVAAWDAR
jgi:hypothetical protein